MYTNPFSARPLVAFGLTAAVASMLAGCGARQDASHPLGAHHGVDASVSLNHATSISTSSSTDTHHGVDASVSLDRARGAKTLHGWHHLSVPDNGDGCVVWGLDKLPADKDNAALCDPDISGPHQWPLSVYTKGEFHPDPDAEIKVKVVATDSKDGDQEHPLKTVITVYGKQKKYPGQDH